jgi:hypothetical protein
MTRSLFSNVVRLPLAAAIIVSAAGSVVFITPMLKERALNQERKNALEVVFGRDAARTTGVYNTIEIMPHAERRIANVLNKMINKENMRRQWRYRDHKVLFEITHSENGDGDGSCVVSYVKATTSAANARSEPSVSVEVGAIRSCRNGTLEFLIGPRRPRAGFDYDRLGTSLQPGTAMSGPRVLG